MTISLILTVVFLGMFLAYAVGVPLVTQIGAYLHPVSVFCPGRETYARVGVHPLGAALSTGYGMPHLSVRSCTLLKPGEHCNERCLERATF